MKTSKSIKVLIAGIGSGSLGIELLKCFSLAKEYELFGVDVAPNAYGHYDKRFLRTKVISDSSPDGYIEQLFSIAKELGVDVIAPGAEATNKLVAANKETFEAAGLVVMVNSKAVIELCADKVACNNFLSERGFATAKTLFLENSDELDGYHEYPCVIKPSKDSGGSNMVFLAENADEARFFVQYLRARGFDSCVQEYINSPDEFTVGVLSSQEGEILSVIALKRNLSSKLSRAMTYGDRIISSGWSQGTIDYFDDICTQATKIAQAIRSTWAMNIQGRLADNNRFIPFEINPRHSGTSFMRALAGVNEPVIALRYLFDGEKPTAERIRPGQYLRVLTEYVVPADKR